jgi:hypothetical protein
VAPEATFSEKTQPSAQPPTAAKGRRRWIWATGAAVVIAAVVVVVVIVFNSTGTHGTPPGTSLSSFESSILSQVKSTGANGFDATSATTASCIMPSNWATGRTFKCFVYNSHGTGIGEVDGTILPTQAGDSWNSNNQWFPSP